MNYGLPTKDGLTQAILDTIIDYLTIHPIISAEADWKRPNLVFEQSDLRNQINGVVSSAILPEAFYTPPEATQDASGAEELKRRLESHFENLEGLKSTIDDLSNDIDSLQYSCPTTDDCDTDYLQSEVQEFFEQFGI